MHSGKPIGQADAGATPAELARDGSLQSSGRPIEPSADDVAAFLRRHPAFLNDRSDLLETLTPPAERQGRRVLDMQRFVIQRLQRTIATVRAQESEMVTTLRANRSSTARVHAAVLALCESGALENLTEIISNDLPTILEIDVVMLAVEAEPEQIGSLRSTHGIILQPRGRVDALLGPGRDVLLTDAPTEEAELFAGAASLVKSVALLRLRLGRPGRPALLALGSRDPARFAPGQATDLLTFLAEALARRMREWLDYAL